METESTNGTSKKKSHIWLLTTLGIVGILAIIMIVYFVVLVRENAENINGDTSTTNVATTASVATLDDPYGGNEDAKIVIVEFADFQCPYCYQSFPVVREILSTYGEHIKVIYRDFPLTDIHPDAQKAAEAGECAQEQDKFWEMHDKIFINRSDMSVTALKRYAAEIGMDAATFSTCLDNGEFASEVQDDFSDGIAAGVDGTPTFFINDHRYDGVMTIEELTYIIESLIEIYAGES